MGVAIVYNDHPLSPLPVPPQTPRIGYLPKDFVVKYENPVRPPNGITILIDPGHGGDTGSIAYGGIQEDRFALEFSRRIRDELTRAGYTVLLTRNDHVSNPTPRVQVINEIWNEHRFDAFISVHFNDNNSDATNGPETFYADTRPGDIPFARAVHDGMVSGFRDRELTFHDRGLKSDIHTRHRQIGVLRDPTGNFPRALIEIEFMNAWFMSQLATRRADYLVAVSTGVRRGLDHYFNLS
jgi:N-acetylmuramoyl-L-alanine amidase